MITFFQEKMVYNVESMPLVKNTFLYIVYPMHYSDMFCLAVTSPNVSRSNTADETKQTDDGG